MLFRILYTLTIVGFVLVKRAKCGPVEVSRPELEVDTDDQVPRAEDGIEANSNVANGDSEYEQNNAVLRSAVGQDSESDQLLMLSTSDRPAVRAKREAPHWFPFYGARG